MNLFSNSCRRHHQDLCLLASGLLSETDRTGIKKHLTQCADCRSYYDEIKTVTASLAGWERPFAHMEADAAFRSRTTTAILSANRPKRVHVPAFILRECWRELIWPSRRIWAGLAAAWMLILAADISMQDHSPQMMAKTLPTPEMLQAWRQQERLLAELIGPGETRAATPPKTFSPSPSSERRFEILMT